ncbi:MAG: PEP-CTERM sorting domain-containing protein [Massilia sp.]
MKRYALAAALALTISGAAQATAIDITPPAEAVQVQPASAPPAAASAKVQWAAPRTSDLPEPAVFAMMLLGLVLIGYRASRDSSEKFK